MNKMFIRVQHGEVLAISNFGVEDRILVLILSVPGHCLLCSLRCCIATEVFSLLHFTTFPLVNEINRWTSCQAHWILILE